MSPAPPGESIDEQLRRADRVLSAHLDNTPLAMIEWTRGTHIARWNGQAERIFGWTAGEVRGKNVLDWQFVHEDDLSLVKEHVRQMSEGHEHRCVVLNRNYTKDGRVIWCEWHNSLLVDEAGGESSVLSLVLEVTERKAGEEELIRSEARLRAALSSAQMMGWDWDLALKRSYFSTNYAAFYGLPPNPNYGDNEAGWIAVHPDDIPTVEAALSRAVERCEELDYEYRGRFPRGDGETRWFITRGQVLCGPTGKAERIVAVTTDVTDRKIAERERAVLDRQLLDAQKWESLGVLAGGVAHDFNNILTIIMGSAGLGRKLLPSDSPAGPLLDQIDDASRRAADLCRQMLAYSGRGLTAIGRTDLNRLIREVAPLLEVPAARHARLRYDLAPRVPDMQADAAQVRQVLVGLVMNAAEALPGDGGDVTIRSRAAELNEAELAAYRLSPPPGRYLVLEVADSGSGMTDNVKSRMFDPFFTTKFPGRGLGLSAVLGIVRGHGGGIAVETQPGRGTTVYVLWPVDPSASGDKGARSDRIAPIPATAPAAALHLRPEAAARAHGFALVIDDEIFIRELTASSLEELGYETLLAADGPSGVREFLQHAATIRVVVIDAVMPGMTGVQVLEAIRAAAPELPAVLISNFAERPPIDAKTAFVQKPFRPETLIAAVQQITR